MQPSFLNGFPTYLGAKKNLVFLEPYIKEDVGRAGGMVWILFEPGTLNIAFNDVTVLCWELEHQKSPTWSGLRYNCTISPFLSQLKDLNIYA